MTNNTPLRAIRLKCLDCMGGSSWEVKLCPVTYCPLYPWRSGHRPKQAGSASGKETDDKTGADQFGDNQIEASCASCFDCIPSDESMLDFCGDLTPYLDDLEFPSDASTKAQKPVSRRDEVR